MTPEERYAVIEECATVIQISAKVEDNLASAYSVGSDGFERHEGKSARHANRAATLHLAAAAVRAIKTKPLS